jgi:hypothetical protein
MRPFDDLDGLAASRMPAKPNTDRPVGATQPPRAIESRSDKKEAERRRADEQAQAAQAEAAGQGRGVQYTGGKKDAIDARDKQTEAGLAAKGDDGMDELARARQAAAQEIDAQNARSAMDQRSRAGLGGLGLSGAASAAEGDLARTQARSKTLTMQEFDQNAEDQAFTEMQRRAALDDLEDAADVDYDNDGMVSGRKVGGKIGDGDPENDPFTGKPENKPGAVAPTAGGKAKPIDEMTPEEFNRLSDKQALAAGWRPEQWLDDKGKQSSALFAASVLWIGPNGQEMIVPVDDFGERMSSGLEYED